MRLTKMTHKLESLSQETRLKTFRLLVKAGGEGISAGEISKQLEVPTNTLSFHLSHLVNADLITSKRKGRSIIYFANFEEVESLIRFLLEKCCTDSKHVSCMTESTRDYIDSIFTKKPLSDQS
ncbi:MAG: DNA-binding transcriptional ArsR family regulator [Rickettsiales bacterium]|jgi:DNA-binding transcriptional ArsR family regulator